ncbi:MAG: galactokinase [Rhizobiales bacterium]|nr:galactokinase [Hyphomicrobiales bacterium]
MSSSTLPPVDPESLATRFKRRFGTTPRLFHAPGRINIIGEHTDYTGGLVMPAAIDRWCVVAAAPNDTGHLRLVATSFAEKADFPLADLKPRGDWCDYVAGVADTLLKAGIKLTGADIWIESDVPMGAGVSSSAALEVATLIALLALNGETAPGQQIARWAQAAENDFVGMPCGIMDQFASMNGIKDHALMLDCQSLAATPAPLPARASFLLVNSMVRHAHVEGSYKKRRDDCESTTRKLGVASLRDLSVGDLPDVLQKLTDDEARRCRHVVTENERVRHAAIAMGASDLDALGQIMQQSHASLRDDMEVSVEALDQLAAIANETEGVYGARMMGGGFGGSIIALVDRNREDSIRSEIQSRYGNIVHKLPDAFVTHAVDGAREVIL